MKHRLFVASSLLFVIFISSCKSNSTGPSNSTNSGPLSAMIAGKAWTPSATPTATSLLGMISIAGATHTDALQIGINPGTDTGTYSFSGFFPSVSAVYTIVSGVKGYNATSGTLHLTQKTASHVTGTFNFVGTYSPTDSVVVTNGVFDVDYH